ncbi:hypothetical protein [Methanorbis furvi]|uniref:Uncharacterized protein n=1 Tax=Methanorbis furvi TaxID=3028299 RepID=A0AAE4S9U5_9EURY|nr:hypothetical protein [Methanocorpusculaceae archaeon Ag1]
MAYKEVTASLTLPADKKPVTVLVFNTASLVSATITVHGKAGKVVRGCEGVFTLQPEQQLIYSSAEFLGFSTGQDVEIRLCAADTVAVPVSVLYCYDDAKTGV